MEVKLNSYGNHRRTDPNAQLSKQKGSYLTDLLFVHCWQECVTGFAERSINL